MEYKAVQSLSISRLYLTGDSTDTGWNEISSISWCIYFGFQDA